MILIMTGPSYEDGYRWLSDRVASNVTRLQETDVEGGSPIAQEDAFLASISQSFQFFVKQPLGSALDHLQLVGETLTAKGQPHSFAETSLIRTAITASSYSLWMLHDDPKVRRLHGLQFAFRDGFGYSKYVKAAKPDPETNREDADKADEVLIEIAHRRDWIVLEANRLETVTRTPDKYRDSMDSDTKVVGHAATIVPKASKLVDVWQYMSGYAHGLPWPTHQNWQVVDGPDADTGMVTVKQVGNPDQLLEASFLAVLVIEKAIEQFKILGRC